MLCCSRPPTCNACLPAVYRISPPPVHSHYSGLPNATPPRHLRVGYLPPHTLPVTPTAYLPHFATRGPRIRGVAAVAVGTRLRGTDFGAPLVRYCVPFGAPAAHCIRCTHAVSHRTFWFLHAPAHACSASYLTFALPYLTPYPLPTCLPATCHSCLPALHLQRHSYLPHLPPRLPDSTPPHPFIHTFNTHDFNCWFSFGFTVTHTHTVYRAFLGSALMYAPSCYRTAVAYPRLYGFLVALAASMG